MKDADNVEETQWTDAQVRWTAANHNLGEEDPADDETSQDSSPFQPDPNQIFSHEFSFSGVNINIELRGYEEESDTIYVSTGLTLWRSSELLCEYLINEGATRLESLLAKQGGRLRILELGAGLGLAGILAQRLLCVIHATNSYVIDGSDARFENESCIVLTDGDIHALKVLRQNVKKNVNQSPSSITVEQLIWGQSMAATFLEHHQPFDLLLAADAIYVLANVKPFMQTVEVLLKKPHGELWFSYCRRRQVSVRIEDVLEEAGSIGLSYHAPMEEDDILVYVFRWTK